MSPAIEQDEAVRRLARDGKFREAAEACDRMNQQYPEFERGWYTASRLAMQVKEPKLAVSAIDQALRLSPGKPAWLLHRLECLVELGDFASARVTAAHLIDHQFDSVQASGSFANMLSRLGMNAESQRQYTRAAEQAPNDAQIHYNLATVEHTLGNAEAAQKAVTQCLSLSPDDANAHLLRAGLRTQTLENNNVEALETAFKRLDETPRRRVQLCHALAKEYEDLGEFEKSFKYLKEGATTRRKQMTYRPDNDIAILRRIRSVYTEDVFDGSVEGFVNAESIFVVGMPRSGTTLVDRILGQHSVVQSAGALQVFSLELSKHCRMAAGADMRGGIDLVDTSRSINYEALGEDYIARARPNAETSAFFVDKLPLNFLYLGLIHLALPKAKIVLVDRDPMDTCCAAYKTLFERVYPYSYDLEELANYYIEYRKLTDHWQTVMPDTVHVVKYEELVENPKPVVENLLSYCGLSFDEACLSSYETVSPTTEMTADQIRGGLFESSVGAWRNFEKQLAPVARILGVKL